MNKNILLVFLLAVGCSTGVQAVKRFAIFESLDEELESGQSLDESLTECVIHGVVRDNKKFNIYSPSCVHHNQLCSTCINKRFGSITGYNARSCAAGFLAKLVGIPHYDSLDFSIAWCPFFGCNSYWLYLSNSLGQRFGSTVNALIECGIHPVILSAFGLWQNGLIFERSKDRFDEIVQDLNSLIPAPRDSINQARFDAFFVHRLFGLGMLSCSEKLEFEDWARAYIEVLVSNRDIRVRWKYKAGNYLALCLRLFDVFKRTDFLRIDSYMTCELIADNVSANGWKPLLMVRVPEELDDRLPPFWRGAVLD